MRIAQVAPLWEPVPPPRYGAVETLVADLTGELARRGHEVTVFASGDSSVTGLSAVCSGALNHDGSLVEPEAYRLLQMRQVIDRAAEFDVIHSHLHSNTGCLGLLALTVLVTPVVHTVHCFFNSDNRSLFLRLAGERFVAISADQRLSLPGLNYQATVHHGVDLSRIPFREVPDSPPYLAFLGRLRPEKGAHLAIEVARRLRLPLKIAGRVKEVDRPYARQMIKPHIDGHQIEYLGELDHASKLQLLGGAVATLLPTTLPEPFGLVTIESMATGTPVVGFDAGAFRELVAHGRTGFIARTMNDLTRYTRLAARLDRGACRSRVATAFSLPHMVDQYEEVYQEVRRPLIATPG
ncbi:MAG: glycosyltransferase family 4 protein [Dactylosporangium sp.]|nr:glycosyltransferase family 4 protein [Dactylosporangium sp.]NNJ62164.1 glycosyltransferase family 4 protein [Dactylosporangium sp.]